VPEAPSAGDASTPVAPVADSGDVDVWYPNSRVTTVRVLMNHRTMRLTPVTI